MNRSIRNTLLCAFASAASLAMTDHAVAQSLATLGNVSLTAKDVTQMTDSRPQLKPQILASEQALEALVRQELLRRALLAEARTRGWDQRPDVAKAVEAASEEVILNTYLNRVSQVPQDYPAEAAVKEFYDANQAGLRVPARYHLAQIFIARPASKGEMATAEQRATDIAIRAQNAGANFAALAKAESADAASRDKGGDIGWVIENNVAPAIRAVLPQLQPGTVSKALSTTNGWHIVRLIESKPQGPATFEEAHPAIVQRLRAERAAQLRKAYVDELLKNTPPKIDSAALGTLRKNLR